MMRGRTDGQSKKLVSILCFVILVGFLFVYYGPFGSQVHSGASSLRKLGSSYLGGEEDADLGSKIDDPPVKFGMEEGEEGIIPKSFPVSSI